MFWKKKEPEPLPDLTNEVYYRWLRACCPQPIEWFIRQDEDTQEACAIMGDERTMDVCCGIGHAVRNPKLAEAGANGDDSVAQEEVLRKVAGDLAAKILRGEAMQEAAAASQPKQAASFMGRAPDEA